MSIMFYMLLQNYILKLMDYCKELRLYDLYLITNYDNNLLITYYSL